MAIDPILFSGKSIEEVEELALSPPTSFEKDYLAQAISEIRRLEHMLSDPNYQYCGSRIHRQAIVTRNQSNDDLRKQIKALETKIKELTPPI